MVARTLTDDVCGYVHVRGRSMQATFENESLEKCPICGRTFRPEALVIHSRSCRPDRPAKAKGTALTPTSLTNVARGKGLDPRIFGSHHPFAAGGGGEGGGGLDSPGAREELMGPTLTSSLPPTPTTKRPPALAGDNVALRRSAPDARFSRARPPSRDASGGTTPPGAPEYAPNDAEETPTEGEEGVPELSHHATFVQPKDFDRTLQPKEFDAGALGAQLNAALASAPEPPARMGGAGNNGGPSRPSPAPPAPTAASAFGSGAPRSPLSSRQSSEPPSLNPISPPKSADRALHPSPSPQSGTGHEAPSSTPGLGRIGSSPRAVALSSPKPQASPPHSMGGHGQAPRPGTSAGRLAEQGHGVSALPASVVLANFCDECGCRYPREASRFCGECGTPRARLERRG
eukprot:jgi/Mesvir1/23748/Mv18684-RA.2